MRFMALMIPGPKVKEAGWQPDPKAIEEMMKYNEELSKAGILLALDGLQSPEKGARVHFGAGKPTVTDGPFAEAREVVGGYWMWQVKSKEEAVEWAKRVPAEPGQVIEVRQVFEMSDFSDELRDAAGELSSPPPQQPVGDL